MREGERQRDKESRYPDSSLNHPVGPSAPTNTPHRQRPKVCYDEESTIPPSCLPFLDVFDKKKKWQAAFSAFFTFSPPFRISFAIRSNRIFLYHPLYIAIKFSFDCAHFQFFWFLSSVTTLVVPTFDHWCLFLTLSTFPLTNLTPCFRFLTTSIRQPATDILHNPIQQSFSSAMLLSPLTTSAPSLSLPGTSTAPSVFSKKHSNEFSAILAHLFPSLPPCPSPLARLLTPSEQRQ